MRTEPGTDYSFSAKGAASITARLESLFRRITTKRTGPSPRQLQRFREKGYVLGDNGLPLFWPGDRARSDSRRRNYARWDRRIQTIGTGKLPKKLRRRIAKMQAKAAKHTQKQRPPGERYQPLRPTQRIVNGFRPVAGEMAA